MGARWTKHGAQKLNKNRARKFGREYGTIESDCAHRRYRSHGEIEIVWVDIGGQGSPNTIQSKAQGGRNNVVRSGVRLHIDRLVRDVASQQLFLYVPLPESSLCQQAALIAGAKQLHVAPSTVIIALVWHPRP